MTGSAGLPRAALDRLPGLGLLSKPQHASAVNALELHGTMDWKPGCSPKMVVIRAFKWNLTCEGIDCWRAVCQELPREWMHADEHRLGRV